MPGKSRRVSEVARRFSGTKWSFGRVLFGPHLESLATVARTVKKDRPGPPRLLTRARPPRRTLARPPRRTICRTICRTKRAVFGEASGEGHSSRPHLGNRRDGTRGQGRQERTFARPASRAASRDRLEERRRVAVETDRLLYLGPSLRSGSQRPPKDAVERAFGEAAEPSQRRRRRVSKAVSKAVSKTVSKAVSKTSERPASRLQTKASFRIQCSSASPHRPGAPSSVIDIFPGVRGRTRPPGVCSSSVAESVSKRKK